VYELASSLAPTKVAVHVLVDGSCKTRVRMPFVCAAAELLAVTRNPFVFAFPTVAAASMGFAREPV
jgi:hypothetical protein